MAITATHLGIMRDIANNKLALDEMGDWLREQLIDLIFHEPQLIDVVGPAVILTDAGRDALTAGER